MVKMTACLAVVSSVAATTLELVNYTGSQSSWDGVLEFKQACEAKLRFEDKLQLDVRVCFSNKLMQLSRDMIGIHTQVRHDKKYLFLGNSRDNWLR